MPNVVTAGARHGVGRVLLGQLLLADWAGFSHHVGHGLLLLVSSGMRPSIELDATNRGSGLSDPECSHPGTRRALPRQSVDSVSPATQLRGLSEQSVFQAGNLHAKGEHRVRD